MNQIPWDFLKNHFPLWEMDPLTLSFVSNIYPASSPCLWSELMATHPSSRCKQPICPTPKSLSLPTLIAVTAWPLPKSALCPPPVLLSPILVHKINPFLCINSSLAHLDHTHPASHNSIRQMDLAKVTSDPSEWQALTTILLDLWFERHQHGYSLPLSGNTLFTW